MDRPPTLTRPTVALRKTMQEITTSTPIAASPSTVWKVLMDFAAYPEWNPFITSIAGDATPGESLDIELSRPNKKPMSIAPHVVTADVESRFAWLGTIGIRGILDGYHQFVLEPTPEGTLFNHFEEFTGLLVPLVLPLIRKSTAAGFTAMNEALKIQAENYDVS